MYYCNDCMNKKNWPGSLARSYGECEICRTVGECHDRKSSSLPKPLMKIYITFGQAHAHRVNNQTFDKDSVAEIQCKDHAHGREIAFDLFGPKFCFSYEEHEIKRKEKFMSFFPRGIIKAN